MAPRRWLLMAFALGSLVALVYAGILVAFSVPVTEEMAAPMMGVEPGTRALVVPRPAPLAEPGSFSPPREGAMLVVANGTGGFPASSIEPRLVRALFHLQPDANGTFRQENVTLQNVTRYSGNGTTTPVNITFNLAALSQGRAGYVVRTDADANVTFVPQDDVVGEVARFQEGSGIVTLFVLGAAGFVAPLVVLVLTHQGAGKAGAAAGLCAECRAPLPNEADFCMHCGAWRAGKGS